MILSSSEEASASARLDTLRFDTPRRGHPSAPGAQCTAATESPRHCVWAQVRNRDEVARLAERKGAQRKQGSLEAERGELLEEVSTH